MASKNITDCGRDLDKAFIHPEQPFGAHLIREQGELKEIETAIIQIFEKYPEFRFENPLYEAKFNVGKFRKAFESGKLEKEDEKKLAGLKDRFIAIAKKKFAIPLRVSLSGAELSPEDKPMCNNNPKLTSIDEAIQVKDQLVVSKNVIGQLNGSQLDKLCQVSGAHAVSEFHHTRFKLTSPYGVFPNATVPLPRAKVFGGYVYWNFAFKGPEVWELKKVQDPFGKPFFVPEDLAKIYDLKQGSYELQKGRLDFLGEEKIGKTLVTSGDLTYCLKPGPYDKTGVHLVYPQGRKSFEKVSPKYDGEFAMFTVRDGNVSFKTRAGIDYSGKVDVPNMKGYAEFGKDWLRVLYIRTFMGNNLHLDPEVQEAIVEALNLKMVDLAGEKKDAEGGDPEVDGLVVHALPQQWFVKFKKTCDLTWAQLKLVDEELGLKVKEKFGDSGYFPGVAEYEISGKELIFVRKRHDKYIGNKIARVKMTMESKTFLDIKKEHGLCECNICTF